MSVAGSLKTALAKLKEAVNEPLKNEGLCFRLQDIFFLHSSHSKYRLAVADPSPQSIYCDLQFTKIVKLHVLK